MQNADFSPLRGLGTDACWLSFVEKKGAVKAAMIDTNALIKVITQGSPVYALAFVAFVEPRVTQNNNGIYRSCVEDTLFFWIMGLIVGHGFCSFCT